MGLTWVYVHLLSCWSHHHHLFESCRCIHHVFFLFPLPSFYVYSISQLGRKDNASLMPSSVPFPSLIFHPHPSKMVIIYRCIHQTFISFCPISIISRNSHLYPTE